ncbi:MAG TPA: zinc-dependent metalloprotease [Mycobacteriales bacterium]|jgi:putative hydrolase|nr:zinc-dependent metalloprotease [Mycobacteriales bacterium]
MTDFPFGFQLPGGSGPDPADPAQMQAFMAQLQQMFASPSDGPVNWNLARQLAEQTARSGDRSLTAAERDAVAEAVRLADLWLDPATSLPSGVTTPAAWSRLEWIEHTMPTWRALCDPVAARVVGAMQHLVPEEMRAQLGPMASMLGSLGGVMFGGQVGQGLGQLSAEVLGASDIGIPLGPVGTAALLPAGVAAFAEGLERPEDEVRLYVALREAAHQRLFAHVPWLRGHLLDSVDAYARGISVDRDAVETAMSQIDPTDPESMQDVLSRGLFQPEDTPQQRAALARLETALALVEGWVAHVVEQASAGRLPSGPALAEAFRRRRAGGGPAEQTFATLVGLELRPRRLREATALWAALTEHRGADGRDALWGHPDLLPSSEDLDDPVGFAQRTDDGHLPGLEDL